MKRFISLLLISLFLFTISSCGEKEVIKEVEKIVYKDKEIVKPEKHLLNENPEQYDEDDFESDYFKAYNDYYNMESEGSIHIINHVATYQQTTSYSCGPCSALVVFNYYGFDVKNTYTEEYIINGIGALKGEGCNIVQMYDFYIKEGWTVVDYYASFTKKKWAAYNDFISFVTNMIDFGYLIQVDWNPGGGHWVTIIGVDLGDLSNTGDDVLIFADSSDTYDGYRDGYTTTVASRFFKNFKEGTGSGTDGAPYLQSYIIVEPPVKE